jgi:threonine synthase
MRWEGVIRHYAAFLPPVPDDCVVTLLEGNTPLVPAPRLARAITPGTELFLKYEGLNPTGSFKDRGMTMAVSKAKADGSDAVICASTGNTSASAAAYAARAGMKAFVLIPEGHIALGKLSQSMIHGAKVIQVQGNFDEALALVREISEKHPLTLVNSLNPYRIEGQKTAAFEVCDALDDAPDCHVLPVGNAGNITAYWAGYEAYRNAGRIRSLPKMIGWQAEGAAPIVRGAPVLRPETVATAIRIGNPASWKPAERARDASGGLIRMVSDAEILDAYKLVAATEGVFCEPAAAASIAGVMKLAREEYFRKGTRIVCTLTGHGLKDPDNAIAQSVAPVTIPPTMGDVMKVLGL